MSRSEQKKKQTTIIQGERGKLALSKKRKSVPSKVAVKEPDNDDDEEEESQCLPKKSQGDKPGK